MGAFTQFCGIDVSKDTLDFCLFHRQAPDQFSYGRIPNTLAAIEAAFAEGDHAGTLFVLEHTGSYSSKLLHQLPRMNCQVTVVSPLQSRDFMSSQGITNKNDRQAARSLALFGQARKVRLYNPPSEEMMERRQKLSVLRSLEKQERMLKNQLHALEQYPHISGTAQEALKAVLGQLEEQLVSLRESLCGLSTTPEFDEAQSLAASVKGIGGRTAEAILLATNCLEGFDSSEQVSKFLGVTPSSHESGSSIRKKGGIPKSGNGDVKGLLYMCTRSAIRYNLACKDLYERLRRKGKPHKVAAVAVMHKLIKQLFACVKTKTLFDNEYQLSKSKK